jgi:putative addiction module component (TIGR02574 family)
MLDSIVQLSHPFEDAIIRIAMSALFDQVQKQAQMLTPQEKAALAHLLIEELDSSSEADVEQLWIAESRRRYEAYLRGDVQSVPGDEVMARVRNRLT